LRRASTRLKDRVDAFFRDARHLQEWLRPASTAVEDSYFLRSSVQRVFLFLSWAALMQQALDSMPAETLRARRDLQRQYALLDLSVRALTDISMFPSFPGYPTDKAEMNLFTGTVDELADLGVAIYNQHAYVIPASEFADAYRGRERSLMVVRGWIGPPGGRDPRSAVIRARFACLGAVLTEVVEESYGRSFSEDSVLRARLTDLTTPANGYDFASILRGWTLNSPVPEGDGTGNEGQRVISPFPMLRTVNHQPKPKCHPLRGAIQHICAPGRTRTCDRQIRSLLLYPAELRARR
jgi:hypothetical protein